MSSDTDLSTYDTGVLWYKDFIEGTNRMEWATVMLALVYFFTVAGNQEGIITIAAITLFAWLCRFGLTFRGKNIDKPFKESTFKDWANTIRFGTMIASIGLAAFVLAISIQMYDKGIDYYSTDDKWGLWVGALCFGGFIIAFNMYHARQNKKSRESS